MRRTAAMIAADIYSRLDWDPLVQHAPIDVLVQSGRVSLKGRVGGPAERRRVIAHAWVKSVVAVDAKGLVVDAERRPDKDVRLRFPTDAEISVTLGELTAFWPSLASANLSMTVVGGVVTLRGTVQTLAEKQAAEDMARSAVGVVAVSSELRGPWWKPPAPPQRISRPKRTRRGR
jgi:osmotically-inducible protein OsmY